MKMHVATNTPAGRLTLLAALLAGLSTSALAASPDLVISQVYGGGASGGSTYNRDFIELFNRGSAPVSLKGKSLQYASATGANWSSFNALPDVTLQPGQYFLVAGNPQTAGADIGPIDHNWAMSISATAGSVAVANTTAQLSAATENTIIDLVGYGAANRRETAPTAVLSVSTQAQRLAAGCTDTDNNAGDFAVVGASLPRTTNTPLNACSGTGPGPNPDPVAQPIVPTCPATLQVTQGSAGSAAITARDIDSIVNSAVLSAGAVTGIELRNFIAASGTGATASAMLSIGANVGAGSYPVTITFGNNDGQSASCSVNVSVGGQLTIPQIQGAAPRSAFAGTVQTTQGVVTAVISGGYFIQDPTGDGNPATSDGLYVFGSTTGIAVGDLVRVTGTVTEYTPSGANRSYTELTNVSTTTRIGTGSVAPTNVVLPNANLADVEGMLVRFTTPLTVNGNAYVEERGELTLSAGRREIPTNRYVPGSPEARALAASNAANMIVLDDGIFVTPTTIPYLFQDGTVRAGDTVTDLTGVVDFGAMGGGGASFKLQPTVTPTFSRTNERLPAPVVAGGNLRVASANVLNFFTTFTNGNDAWGRTGQGCKIGNTTNRSNCRGADNMAEFVRQRDKIVSSLVAVNADVVGLMEIQNNDDIAAGYLVEQLNGVMGANTYAVVPKPAATGTDAIRVAMIYKPGAVSLVGGALSDGDDINNRPPMAQTFKAANGGKFSLVVNHLKSKGGCGGGAGNTDSGDGQGCWNLTRVQQAARLRDYFLPQVVAAANDADVLIVGDMNAYGMEDPIRLLNTAGYVNEIERFVRPTGIPYSYVFGAESGYLDHALASSSLSPQVAGVTEWHNNADEPDAIDYNIESGTGQDPYQAGPYRASDHDPVVVSLNLAGTTVDVTASTSVTRSAVTLVRATGKYSATVKVTNTSAVALSGPLHLVLEGLPAGVTLDNKSGQQGGAPYLTLPGTTLAPGATVTVTTTFANPSKTNIVYTAKIVSGTF